jgi:hypothetical protein
MKNNLFTQLGFILVLTLSIGWAGAQTQTSMVIGQVKNGAGVITNEENAIHVLKVNLPPGAIVSNLKLEYSDYDAHYFLTAKVSNVSVSSTAIQLTSSGTTLLAMAGPGVQLTCSGYNCGDCRISFTSKGRPQCKCFDPNPLGEVRCDMISTITIGL